MRQMLIVTKDVPFTDGWKRAPRHEGHALNVTYKSLKVFATYNFADSYSANLFRMLRREEEVNGFESCSAEDTGELRFILSPDDQICPRYGACTR